MKNKLGDVFPTVKANTTKGIYNIPEDFQGKWFVFFVHPSDYTPVCTTEFVSLQKQINTFKEMNVELIALSVDNLRQHYGWLNWIKQNLDIEITFPVIGDENAKIAKKLGCINKNLEKELVRGTFIVDPKGKIRLIQEYPIELGRNINEIIRSIKVLQIYDKTNLVGSANWPNNEILKDKWLIDAKDEINTKRHKNIVELSSWFRYCDYEDEF